MSAVGAPALPSAFIDESMRFDGEVGHYILGAVLATPAACDALRASFRAIRVGSQPKTHWRSEGKRQRDLMMTAVSEAPIESIVAVGAPLDRKRQERARAKCLEHLLWQLGQWKVEEVHLESRTSSLNARDEQTIDRLRGRQLIPRALRVTISQPSTEPMLWVSDAVVGAVGDQVCGKPRWIEMIGHQVIQLPVSV